MKTVYDAIKAWRDQFNERAQIDPPLAEYYRGMVSGLTIALQEIDRERYDREEHA